MHDQNCACAKTITDWIFAPGTGIEEIEWRESLTSYLFAKCSKDSMRKRELLIQDGKEKKNLDEILKRRLFAVTRCSLQEDLYTILEGFDSLPPTPLMKGALNPPFQGGLGGAKPDEHYNPCSIGFVYP